MSKKSIYKGGRTFIDNCIIFLAKLLLKLRYRIKIKGLEKIKRKGVQKILFLPNHVALIDPVILRAILHKYFNPRTIADKYNVANPIFNWITKRLGGRTIPDMTIDGVGAQEELNKVMQETIDGMNNGENLLLYPGGRLKRQKKEVLGATSATKELVDKVENIRVVLIRHNGLWGSIFSWGATGNKPHLLKSLKKALKYLFLNLFFFLPRRNVEIEFFEPQDIPVDQDKLTLNKYIENFYNANNLGNLYVPYLFWKGEKAHHVPEHEKLKIQGDIDSVPQSTKEIVLNYLYDLTGLKKITPDQKLDYDLGLDSISIAEILAWLEKEFGFPQADTDAYKTVADIMLAATGKAIETTEISLKTVSKKWRKSNIKEIIKPQEGTIQEVFLNTAKKCMDKPVIVDNISGEKTYREIITAIFVLKPYIEAIEGKRLGILLPAGVGADILFLTALFANKTPVMVNWTTGIKNIIFSLQNVEAKKIVTSQKLITKLKNQGLIFNELEEDFIYLEDLRKKINLFHKIKSLLKVYLSWKDLYKGVENEMAVILFTSGSESNPKSVPLTHKNVLANVKFLAKNMPFYQRDVLLGILPPFHSFGLTATLLFALSIGLHVAYYANPTEAKAISKIIEHYKVTTIAATPTFLQSILRAGTKEQLQTLKYAILGAEKCSETLYKKFIDICPGSILLEGYGVTECSPVISMNFPDNPVIGSIGKAFTYLEYAIIDLDTGKRAGYNNVGKLIVRGDSVFNGYINYGGKSPFVEFEGKTWYNTGDLVREREDGIIFFSGRLKRFIKIGGEMISLPAIEEILNNHLVSKDAESPQIAVESNNDEENPEVILFTTIEIDRETANKCIKTEGLSPLHNIRRIKKLEEIPLLGTGKINYRALKKLI